MTDPCNQKETINRLENKVDIVRDDIGEIKLRPERNPKAITEIIPLAS